MARPPDEDASFALENEAPTVTHIRPSDAALSPGLAGRFAPGTLLAARYRIVAPLGTGGAGEVYRAEDTKLGQTVALKFIARPMTDERELLNRIIREVRTGRELSHPNLCRIYDLSEAGSQYFISMEYVDGENLASLLRRVGRLPEDKAVEVAHEICAGLAAAHERGVVHRDMKPSNVMIDGRGHARITDFGLAIVPGEVHGGVLAGTPAYMAPEQLNGEEATERSDIYSLGLVLYEIFTGQRLLAGTLPEIAAAHRLPKRPPSTVVRGIAPAIERIILRCLEEDPALRPDTVREVLNAFPGVDPIRSALNAGETPSPQAIATSARTGEMPLVQAWLAVMGMVAAFAAILVMTRYTTVYRQSPLTMSPDVLADHARAIIRAAGGTPHPAGSRRWMAIDSQVVKDAAAASPSIDRRPALHERPALRFVYRESPLALVPLGRGATVGISDPPFDVAGMVTVILDSTGKLVRYARVPESAPATSSEGEAVDWTPYFAFAGLDRNRFRGLPQAWTVPVEADSKHAWIGTTAVNPATRIEVHAASLAGKPVLFEALAATRPAAAAQNFRAPTTIEEFTGVAGFAVIFVAALIVAAFVARRNLQLGKGDRAAARKVASLVLACLLVAGLLSADHSRDPAGEWGILIAVAGNALSHAGAIWLFYIAAEPYVRRRQPELLISWNRILRGNLRDSLVGRDVLIGCLLGALLHISYAHLIVFVPHWVGMPVPLPDHSFPEKLTGGGWPLVSLAALLGSVPRDAVGALFLFSLCRSVLRTDWLAFGVVTFLSTIPHLGRDVASSAEVPFVALAAAIFVFALSRVSLLSGMVTLFVGSWFAKSVFVFDPRSWLFLPTLFYVAVTVALFLYGFRASLGSKRALGRLRFAE